VNETSSRLSQQAAALRLTFDCSFAAHNQFETAPSDDLLAIRLATEPWALRVSEIAGVFAGRSITRLPSRVPTLLGIASFRGAILPVYDLQALLGYLPVEATRRWLVVAISAPIAFAFDGLDGHLRVPRDAILPQRAGNGRGNHTRAFVSAVNVVRPIVHLPSVLDIVAQQSPATVSRNPASRGKQ
jgi:chemotaxis signal transduction protein